MDTDALKQYWNEWKLNKYSSEQLTALNFIHFVEEKNTQLESVCETCLRCKFNCKVNDSTMCGKFTRK